MSLCMYMVRFVDDLTSGPNRLLGDLLYTSQSFMRGLVSGIYPDNAAGNGLVLEQTKADPRVFPTLDVSRRHVDPAGVRMDGVVQSTTLLYGKHMEPCYDGIPQCALHGC